MTALTTQLVVDAGTKPNFALQTATVADTAEIGSGRDTFVVYKNTDASPKTITITVPGNTAYGQLNPDPALTLVATTGELWIPMRKDYDNATGRADLTVTAGGATGLTVAVVRIS